MKDINNNPKVRKKTQNTPKYIDYRCDLKVIRISKGMTQRDLAREIGKSPEFISMIEHERYFPVLVTRIKIAKALGVDTSAIWSKKEDGK